MTNEFEVKGLDACFEDEDFDDQDFSVIFEFQMLSNIFETLDLMVPRIVISLIHQFCKPGTAYIHTRDGGEFAISLRALGLSKLLSIQAELKPFEPIHLRKCSAHVFSLIASYLAHHRGVKPAEIAKPIRSINLKKCVEDEWDADFANSMTKRELFQLTLVANYIDCQSLMHLMCAKIASLIKGKSPEEIKVVLSEQDAGEADNIIEQQQRETMSICICGYVWHEDLDELKKEELDEGKSELTEKIVIDDDHQGQDLPLVGLDNSSSASSVDIDIVLEDEVALSE